jgi:hypothetical protein
MTHGGEEIMGFSKEFAENASRKVESESAAADYQIVEPIIKKAIAAVVKDNPYLNTADVDIYLQGSYESETNIAFQSKLEMVVEVKKTNEFSPFAMTPDDFIMFDNFYIEFNRFFDVKKFKEVLIPAIEAEIGVKIETGPVNFMIPMHGELQHDVDVCPCFYYKYFDVSGGSIRGKLVYDNVIGENYLIFTNLHAENGKLKDEMTNGNFKKVVRMMKTLIAISRREDGNIKFTRGYYIECLLYNVPNEMYFSLDDDILSVFMKVINWLNFASLSNFVCQNQIWSLWGGADGFWNKDSARRFINDVIEFYNNFPSDRTAIAE